MTPRCHICWRGLGQGPPGRGGGGRGPRPRSGAGTRSAPPRVQQALRGEGSPADLQLKAQSPCPGRALLFGFCRPSSAFFCWWTGDAWLLLLFRADDKELRFLFCGSQGDSFSRFAVLCLSINFKNLAKVSVPGAPDTSPDTQDSQSAFSLSQETAVPKGVSSLLQVQRHSPEVVKGAKGTNVGEAPGQERRVEAIRASASAALPFMASAFRCGHRPHA